MTFITYSKYYDLLYRDKDYRAESDYVHTLINEYFPNASTILELGSGSGAHAEYLCAKGFEVTGLERSAEMVVEAKQKNIQGFVPLEADITDFAIEQTFDVAVSLFHVISYLTENDDLLKTFELTHRHLRPEGIFIFDVWYTPAVLTLRPETRIKRLSDETVHITRIAESVMHSSRNVVDVNYEVKILDKTTNHTETIIETHPMRHFSIPEIDLLARHTGFEILRVEEFQTAYPPTTDTWGVCFVLRKKTTL